MRCQVTKLALYLCFVAGWAVIGTGGARADHESLQKFQVEQICMGTPVNITFYAPDEPLANKVSTAAFQRIREIDRLLSDYDPDSELNHLCRSPAGTPVKVSPELNLVLTKALELSRQTEGAFDVSVGPLMKLWRSARRNKQLPEPDKLAAAKALVGYQHIQLDQAAGTVCLTQQGMQLDLGGIAAGYAADEAMHVFREQGITRVLIDFGGDLVLGDPPPGKEAWKVAIEPLRNAANEGKPLFLSLQNCAVTTSGDAYKHVEIDGVRYSHIIDVQTGLGMTRRSSATVIAPTGLQADALATVTVLLGAQRGLDLISSQPGCSGYVMTATDAAMPVEIAASDSFSTYLYQE